MVLIEFVLRMRAIQLGLPSAWLYVTCLDLCVIWHGSGLRAQLQEAWL